MMSLLKIAPKKLKILLVIGLSLVVQSCGMPGKSEFKKICESEQRQEIYEAVEVKGYYDDAENCNICWQDLVYQGYEYIEISLEEDKVRTSSPFNEPGLWRLSTVPKDSGKCDEYVENNLKKYRSDEKVVSYINSNCVEVKKVDQLSSEYGLFSTISRRELDNLSRSLITKEERIIKNIKTNKIIAIELNYFLSPRRFSNYDSGRSCYGVGLGPKIEGKFLQRTLIPFTIDTARNDTP